MKLFHLHFCTLLFILIGCGPELQTIVNRDQYNRIVLEAELKGEADTLWSKVYTYHYIGPPSPSESNLNQPNEETDVSLDDAGNAARKSRLAGWRKKSPFSRRAIEPCS